MFVIQIKNITHLWDWNDGIASRDLSGMDIIWARIPAFQEVHLKPSEVTPKCRARSKFQRLAHVSPKQKQQHKIELLHVIYQERCILHPGWKMEAYEEHRVKNSSLTEVEEGKCE